MFALTEINTFRQVTHLSLRFVAGNDGAIKKYLAGRVADFKTDIAALREDVTIAAHAAAAGDGGARGAAGGAPSAPPTRSTRASPPSCTRSTRRRSPR